MLSLGPGCLCVTSPTAESQAGQHSPHLLPLSALSQDKPAFREVISQLELDPKCKGLSFSSFLILPFQRITRLKLLVQVEFCSCISPKVLLDHSWNSPVQQLCMRLR